MSMLPMLAISFYISGDANQYLDLSSVRLFATLQNTDGTRAKFLRPLGGLHSFFKKKGYCRRTNGSRHYRIQ